MKKSTRNQIWAGVLVGAIAVFGTVYCYVWGLPF